MKRYFGRVLALPLLVGALAVLPAPATAAPFVVGTTECGDLRKVLDGTRVVWKLTGCPKLEDLLKVSQSTCGNGVVEAGEVCDTGDPFSCGTGTCVACTSCDTPTPTPTPTPSGSADCAQGELPSLARDGFEGWFGRDNVKIQDSEVHTYCFTVNGDSDRLALSVGDRTGSSQCFVHTAEYIPPSTSGWATKTDTGRDTSYTFFVRAGFLPKGVWRIRITADNNPNCADKYQVVAHY